MITLSHHSPRYIALRNCYQHRYAIKALADYPDVIWDKESGAWLVDNRLWVELALALGPWFAAAPVEFWLEFTVYVPPARRRTKQQIMAEKRQQQAAAGRFGRVIVEYMNQGDTK
jgi:hypothetical protein